MGNHEQQCLEVLSEYSDRDGSSIYFRFIAEQTGLTKIQVRRAVRSLARKGLADYVRGLFDDDGMVAGSGYCCTPLGHDAARMKEATPR